MTVMTSTIADFFDQIEPLADAWKQPIGERHETIALMSLAISMKRIADGIEHLCNTPISVVQR